MSASYFFRILYNALYFFLFGLLFILLLVTPVDVIRQALGYKHFYNVLVVALSYLLAVLIIAFIYAARLYVTRTVLANIPKTYIPIDKGDVNQDVRKMIHSAQSRNAAIAYEARPRADSVPIPQSSGPTESGVAPLGTLLHEKGPKPKNPQMTRLKKTVTMEDAMGIALPPHRPVWGQISHAGWASPTSPDLPNLHYSTVISELPNLIEAKALTLAPPDPESRTEPPMLDPEAVAMLQRPPHMGLREYTEQLLRLGILIPEVKNDEGLIADFLELYEASRFSTRPTSEDGFRRLMHLFAEVLRVMRDPDPDALFSSRLKDGTESDIDDNVPKSTNPTTPRSVESFPDTSGSATDAAESNAGSDGDSVRRPALGTRTSSVQTRGGTYRTAPTTPKSRIPNARSHLSIAGSNGDGSSLDNFAQTRKPHLASSAVSLRSTNTQGSKAASIQSGHSAYTTGSGGSSKSVGSSRSAGSSRSVIRLAGPGEISGLPYVLTLTDTR